MVPWGTARLRDTLKFHRKNGGPLGLRQRMGGTWTLGRSRGMEWHLGEVSRLCTGLKMGYCRLCSFKIIFWVGLWKRNSNFHSEKHQSMQLYLEHCPVSGPMQRITEIKSIISSIKASDCTGIITRSIIIRQEKQMCLINPKALEQKPLTNWAGG